MNGYELIASELAHDDIDEWLEITPPFAASPVPSEDDVATQLFLAAATAFANVHELPGIDCDALIAMFRRELGLPDDAAWDAAFVQHIGYCSQYDHDVRVSTWPVPPAASADDLWLTGVELDLLREEPEPGDVFLVWSPGYGRFVRTGIVASVVERRVDSDARAYYECVTLEGDLNERADGRGTLMRCVRRCLSAAAGDCFMRWADVAANGESSRRAA